MVPVLSTGLDSRLQSVRAVQVNEPEPAKSTPPMAPNWLPVKSQRRTPLLAPIAGTGAVSGVFVLPS